MAPPRKSTARKPKEPDMVMLGQALRMMRHDRSLTQEALAEAAGLHWSYIGQIERGERNLTARNVLRLERGLGIAPGAWFACAFPSGYVSLPSSG